MAEPASRSRSRLLRTYGAVGGWAPRGQAGRAVAQWFAPQDSKRFFSSASSSNSSSSNDSSVDDSSPTVASEDSLDPDFRCKVGRQRRRAGGRVSKARPSLAVTPRRLRPRARPPRKCSTRCSPLGPPPPFPGGSPGRLSPGLSVCSQPSDGGQLGTSASLFSPPASPGPGPESPAPGDSVIVTGPSISLDATSLDRAPASCSQEAATGRGRLTRLAPQARSSLTPVLFSLTDSGNPEDSEFGTGAKDRRESCCERELMGKRLESPGLSRLRKKRSTNKVSCQETGAPGAVQTECEEASGPGKTNRPERTGPSQKRKHQEAVETPLLHSTPFIKGQRTGKDSFLAQDLSQLQNDCSWTKARASFSFHKKKIVTAVPDVCNTPTTGSPSGSFIAEYPNSPTLNKTSCAPSPWHSSSMYLLNPLKTPRVTDQKASDAEKVYRECNQEGPIPFSACLSAERLECCEKVGEGVFGEVFQTVDDCAPVALKILPIEGPELVNGSHQKTFEEILPEIIISKELSLLSDAVCHRTGGFIGLHSVRCVRGPYPPLLLKAWDRFHSTKGSANDRPDFFGQDQLFIILEFEFGGIDLEQRKKTLSSIATAKSILHQLTASLAVAEAALHFEHRDLHWGNVLLKKTDLKEVRYTLGGKTAAIPTFGLQVSIIDYTLSRLERDGVVVFCDISKDEDLFTGEGDYQFEIYRLMKKENNNCWGEYHPYSNVLWLHYLTDKVLKEMVFKKKCYTPAFKQIKRDIVHFHKTMLNFSSATDLLCQHSLFK